MHGWKASMVGWALFAPTASIAQNISGTVGLYSRYLDYDLFVLTSQPVVQAVVYAEVSEACSLMAWGSHGLSTRVGGEIDVGGFCGVDIGGTHVTATALRAFTRGARDTSIASLRFDRAGFDLTVEQYVWDANPDGTRVYTGYTFKPAEALTLHPMMIYETGLGVPDILVAGADAALDLGGDLSLYGMALVPAAKANGDDRKARAQVGLRYQF